MQAKQTLSQGLLINAGTAILGGLAALSFAPYKAYPLILISLAGLQAVWQHQSPRQALLSGWCFGLGLYGVGASWVFISIYEHSATPLPLAIFLTLAFISIFAFTTAIQAYLYLRLDLRRFALIGFPALWVLFEWLRTWLFTGFPWLFVGYSVIDTPLSAYAPLTGVFGLSFLIALGASILCLSVSALYNHSPDKWKIVGSGLACFTLVLLGGTSLQKINWTEIKYKKAYRVTIVQGNIAQDIKWEPNHREPILNIYREHTEKNWDSDLIIWPEAAIPAFEHEVTSFMQEMNSKALNNHSAIITGLAVMDFKRGGNTLFYNSIRAFGTGDGLYHKQQLVPFGDFVPFEAELRDIAAIFNLPMSSFTRGEANQAPLTVGKLKIAPYICYEILFPDLVAKTSNYADVLVTISNDAWFGRSAGPHQHFQMARMRAIETGRYLIRSTNNGISAIIDPKGGITHIAPTYKETTLKGEVYAMQGQTPFMRWGSSPILFFCWLAVIGLSLFSLVQQHFTKQAIRQEQ